MPLHPQVKVVLDLMEKAGPPLHHLSPQQARESTLAMRANKGEVEPVGKVEDRTVRDQVVTFRSASIRRTDVGRFRYLSISTVVDGWLAVLRLLTLRAAR